MGFQGQFGRHMNLIATLICTSPSRWWNWGFKYILWPFVYLSFELLIHIVDKFSYSIISPFLLFCKNFSHVIRIVVLFLAALQFTLVQSLHIDFFVIWKLFLHTEQVYLFENSFCFPTWSIKFLLGKLLCFGFCTKNFMVLLFTFSSLVKLECTLPGDLI